MMLRLHTMHSDLHARFVRFALLYGLATLLYHLEQRLPFHPAHVIEWIAALALIVRPWSVAALGSLAMVQAAVIYTWLPFVNTNRLLQLFVSVTIAGAIVALAVRRRGRRLETSDVLQAMRVPLQMVLLIVYIWAFVHKLNWGYLDPNASCAVHLTRGLPLIGPTLASMRTTSIVSSLAIEGLVIPLLVVPRLRRAGSLFAIAWHVVLAAAGYAGFSATMIALLSLIAPVRLGQRAAEPNADRLWPWDVTPRLLYVVPAIAFIDGAAPYLGLKTEGAFAMYSNLRTERGFENHLFITPLRLADYQSDVIRIKSASVRSLQVNAEEDAPILVSEVRRRLADERSGGQRDIEVVFSRNGITHRVDRAERDPLLGARLSYPERKFMRFRDVVVGRCWH